MYKKNSTAFIEVPFLCKLTKAKAVKNDFHVKSWCLQNYAPTVPHWVFLIMNANSWVNSEDSEDSENYDNSNNSDDSNYKDSDDSDKPNNWDDSYDSNDSNDCDY